MQKTQTSQKQQSQREAQDSRELNEQSARSVSQLEEEVLKLKRELVLANQKNGRQRDAPMRQSVASGPRPDQEMPCLVVSSQEARAGDGSSSAQRTPVSLGHALRQPPSRHGSRGQSRIHTSPQAQGDGRDGGAAQQGTLSGNNAQQPPHSATAAPQTRGDEASLGDSELSSARMARMTEAQLRQRLRRVQDALREMRAGVAAARAEKAAQTDGGAGGLPDEVARLRRVVAELKMRLGIAPDDPRYPLIGNGEEGLDLPDEASDEFLN